MENVESEFIKQRDEGRMWFGADGKGIPRRKTYLSEREGKNVWTWWDNKGVGHSQEATKEIGKSSVRQQLLTIQNLFD